MTYVVAADWSPIGNSVRVYETIRHTPVTSDRQKNNK